MKNETEVIGEGEVLLATIKYLVTRSVLPYQVSVPRGQGIDAGSIKIKVKDYFKVDSTSFEPKFVSSGPDIIATSKSEWWVVECKGTGTGVPQTQRNNFDRALASVVSYYEDSPNNVPKQLQDWVKNATVFLGLALPASVQYRKELERRVRPALRQRLNLWVLLYDEQSKKICPVAPNEVYKTSG